MTPLGSGGYGLVWKATDKTLRRTVAVKRLFNVGTVDNQALLEEARKSADLIHQNIVQVYDIVTVDGESLLIMEFVDGPMLWSMLRKNAFNNGATIPLDQFASVVRGILDGVSFAHGRNLCHRDLTPMNILLSSRGVPKIADFGIARILRKESSSKSTTHGGTGHRDFMAPEQAKGDAGDFSSDLFMVGIIGYLLLSGRHPFAHQSGLFSIQELIVDASFLPPRLTPPPNFSTSDKRPFREYAAVVERLLQRERAARFPSAVDVVSFLEAVLPGVECSSCGETVPEQQSFCGFCGSPVRTPTPHITSSPRSPEPTSAMDAAERGFASSRQQNWHEAVRLYRYAMRLDPKYQRAYANLGYALNHLGQYEEAVRVLSDGLALPSFTSLHMSSFYYARSFALERLKRFQEAFDDIKKAIDGQPSSTRNLFQRGKLHFALGRHAEAKADAEVVLNVWADHAGAISLRKDAMERLSRQSTPE